MWSFIHLIRTDIRKASTKLLGLSIQGHVSYSLCFVHKRNSAAVLYANHYSVKKKSKTAQRTEEMLLEKEQNVYHLMSSINLKSTWL